MTNILFSPTARKLRSNKMGEIREDMLVNMYNFLYSYTSSTTTTLPPLSLLLSLSIRGGETREMRINAYLNHSDTDKVGYVVQSNIRPSWKRLEKTINYNR